jgi:hypothetical protein
MDNKYNNLVVRYIKKQNLINHNQNINYKIFYDKEYNEYGDSN